MNKRLLILSGPTHEYIDPVRFIGNASSGLMGKALAEEAFAQGCSVDFITGPVAHGNLPALPAPGAIRRITGAEEMLRTADALFSSADAVIFVAAVADYIPVEKQAEKIPRSAGNLTLRLQATPDIAKTLCTRKRTDQFTIGFALRSSQGETDARRKLIEKNLDGIILNSPQVLGATTGRFRYMSTASGTFEDWGIIEKIACAQNILKRLP